MIIGKEGVPCFVTELSQPDECLVAKVSSVLLQSGVQGGYVPSAVRGGLWMSGLL